jgi:hypothetical protein
LNSGNPHDGNIETWSELNVAYHMTCFMYLT